MLHLSQDEVRSFMTQIDQAIYNHNQWYDSMIRTLICHLPYDRRDVSRNAHRECLFGQWFYSPATVKIRDHPGYIALGVEHERVHTLAAEILEVEATGMTVSLFDFEKFNNTLSSMRLQLQTLKRELEDLLYNRDSLTRTYGRIGMLTKLRELKELVKRGMQCSIIIMDLDRFKSVNDTYGHTAGDKVLVSTSYYIMEHIRPYDRIFRYGGEEFLIVLQHSESGNNFESVERLREGIAGLSIDFDGREIKVTASFGLTLLDPDDAVEMSVERADKAMYAAKAAGRNRTKVWDPSL
jgi:diguanylate cyclase